MKLEPMFPLQEQVSVNVDRTPNIVHYAFVEDEHLELARHLARHDRDLILVATPDNMTVNEMWNKIGCIGFNPNVIAQCSEFPIATIEKDFITHILELPDSIDKIVNHKPITHKPHKYGKGDWLSKRKR